MTCSDEGQDLTMLKKKKNLMTDDVDDKASHNVQGLMTHYDDRQNVSRCPGPHETGAKGPVTASFRLGLQG